MLGSLEIETLPREHGYEGVTAFLPIAILEQQLVNASSGIWVQNISIHDHLMGNLSQIEILCVANSSVCAQTLGSSLPVLLSFITELCTPGSKSWMLLPSHVVDWQ